VLYSARRFASTILAEKPLHRRTWKKAYDIGQPELFPSGRNPARMTGRSLVLCGDWLSVELDRRQLANPATIRKGNWNRTGWLKRHLFGVIQCKTGFPALVSSVPVPDTDIEVGAEFILPARLAGCGKIK